MTQAGRRQGTSLLLVEDGNLGSLYHLRCHHGRWVGVMLLPSGYEVLAPYLAFSAIILVGVSVPHCSLGKVEVQVLHWHLLVRVIMGPVLLQYLAEAELLLSKLTRLLGCSFPSTLPRGNRLVLGFYHLCQTAGFFSIKSLIYNTKWKPREHTTVSPWIPKSLDGMPFSPFSSTLMFVLYIMSTDFCFTYQEEQWEAYLLHLPGSKVFILAFKILYH